MFDFTTFIFLLAIALALGVLILFTPSAYQTYARHRQILTWELLEVPQSTTNTAPLSIPEQIQPFVVPDLDFVPLGAYIEKPPKHCLT